MAYRTERTALALVLGVFAVPGNSLAQSAAPELGTWINHTGKGAVEIYLCGSNLCGKIVWLKEPNNDAGRPKRDANNPDPSKRNRPVCGVHTLANLKRMQGGGWGEGQAYNPEEGKTYDVAVRLADSDTLKVTGSVLFFSKTVVWKRAKGQLQRCDQPAALPPAAAPTAAATPPAAAAPPAVSTKPVPAPPAVTKTATATDVPAAPASAAPITAPAKPTAGIAPATAPATTTPAAPPVAKPATVKAAPPVPSTAPVAPAAKLASPGPASGPTTAAPVTAVPAQPKAAAPATTAVKPAKPAVKPAATPSQMALPPQTAPKSTGIPTATGYAGSSDTSAYKPRLKPKAVDSESTLDPTPQASR